MNEHNDEPQLDDAGDHAAEHAATSAGTAAPDAATLKQIVEAALMAAGQPLTVAQLGELFTDDEKPARDAIARALHDLGEDCATRGIELVEVASGFRFQVRTDLKNWVARLWAERQTRYSRALLETLALIAYRQPITRGEIEQIRGVAVSSNIIRTLEEREWVRIIGHRDVPGKPALFGTTRNFLDYFNLKSLDQLPPLSELRDIPELEPQLAFDGEARSDAESNEPEATDGDESEAEEGAIVAEIDVDGIDPGSIDRVDEDDVDNPDYPDEADLHEAASHSLNVPIEPRFDSEDMDSADAVDPEQRND